MQVPRVRARAREECRGGTRKGSPLAGIYCTTHVHELFSNGQKVQGLYSSS